MVKKTEGVGHKIDMVNYMSSLDIDLPGSSDSKELLAQVSQFDGLDKGAMEERIIDFLKGKINE